MQQLRLPDARLRSLAKQHGTHRPSAYNTRSLTHLAALNATALSGICHRRRYAVSRTDAGYVVFSLHPPWH